MKDHRMPFLGIGAASIVLVLTIVSLSVFATLTISSANGDYTLSQKIWREQQIITRHRMK